MHTSSGAAKMSMSYATLQEYHEKEDVYTANRFEKNGHPLSSALHPSSPSPISNGHNHTPRNEINCCTSIYMHDSPVDQNFNAGSPVDDQSASSTYHLPYDTQRPHLIAHSPMSPYFESQYPHNRCQRSSEMSYNVSSEDDLHYCPACKEGSYPSPSPTVSSDGNYSLEGTPEATDEETEIYLRKTLSIPEPYPVNLSSLPNDIPGNKRPKISDLIKLAIWGSKEHKLTLRQIYRAIDERYPTYKAQKDKPWQRSIRHNLSLKAMFVRAGRPPGHLGKGCYWKLDIRMGECTTRERRRDHARGPWPQEEEDSGSSLSDSTLYGHTSLSALEQRYQEVIPTNTYNLVPISEGQNMPPGFMHSVTPFDIQAVYSNGYANAAMPRRFVFPLPTVPTTPPTQSQWLSPRRYETNADMY